MGSKDRKGIDIIQRGRIDAFCPLKFETDCNFEELCGKINSYIDKKLKRHLSEVKESAQNVEMHNDLFKVITASEEFDAYNTKREELIFEYDKHKLVYGNAFAESHEVFTLFPVEVTLNNGNSVWMNGVLYIFKNLMGIIKLEMPLIDVSSQFLVDYSYDAYIEAVNDKWGVLYDEDITTFYDLRDAYIRNIVRSCRINVVGQEGMLYHVILARFNGQPKEINNIPVDVREDLYRIVAAPVPIRGEVSCRKNADEYIQHHSWGAYNMKYMLSTTGGCLSIVDTTLLDWISNEYKEKWGVETISEELMSIIDRSVIRDLCINVEFALVVQLLKHMNSAYIYSMKLMKPEELHSAQMKYNQNVMFISEIQEHCYGSASEQVEIFERMMPYYLKKDIVADKMQAIDRILIDEEAQRYGELQNFLAIGGLVMALVFGLPAIRETVSIIRILCSFIKNNIPVLTVNNVSVAIWVSLIAILLWKILKTRRINKRKNKLFDTSNDK